MNRTRCTKNERSLTQAQSKIDINYIPVEIMLSPMNLREDFHVHSNYNDHSSADLTISNVLDVAEKKGLQTLAFTEHVRRTSSEWTADYLKEIESLKGSYKRMKIIAGFEAKILSDGSIDCPEHYANQYFLIASFHTAYRDKQIWIRALEKVIQNPDVDVIGHVAPEPDFTLEQEEMERLARLIAANDKIVELNAKYHRPPHDLLLIFKQNDVRFHLGSDAHSLDQVGDYGRISDLIALVEEE
jgi:putative hydrolase